MTNYVIARIILGPVLLVLVISGLTLAGYVTTDPAGKHPATLGQVWSVAR